MATAPRTGEARGGRRRKRPSRGPERASASYWQLYAAISPFYLLFLCFGLIPVGFSLYLSFHRWDGLGSMEWAGLSQYRYLLGDSAFWSSIGTTIVIWALATFPMIFLAMVTAVMLNSAVRFRNFYRFAYFLPNVTSVVAVAIIFGSVFSTNFGLVNAFLQGIGFDQIAWLNTPWGIKIAIAALMTWQWTGYNAIIFLAGLQTVPERAVRGGADGRRGPVQTFFRITLPMMRPVLLFVLVVSTITGLQSFSEPQVLLQNTSNDSTFSGGPGHAGRTMVLYFFQQTFDNNDFGYGAAMAWGIFLVVVLFSIINWRWCSAGAKTGRPAHHGIHPRTRLRRSRGASTVRRRRGDRAARRSPARRPALGLPLLLGRRDGDAHDADIFPTRRSCCRAPFPRERPAASSTPSTSSARWSTRCWSRVATVLVLFFDSLAAFSFAKFDFPGRRVAVRHAAWSSSWCPRSSRRSRSS